MRAYDIIAKKRDGFENTAEELEYLITQYIDDQIPHEQISAWLMAVYFQGMTDAETVQLTKLMMMSGEVLDLSAINGVVVDKHSTGGVGDKTTLLVAPIVAAAGVPVAKLSGRGLGFTGGTIDKLEAIPGFRTTLSTEEFIAQVNDIGLAVIGQSSNLVPADKKLYALRDITATIESIPLIASSIMSKKLASGADKIVLDVKYGSGAFMPTAERAQQLAETMVRIGKDLGHETIAVLSNMDQPLGCAVGNALETMEAIATLKGFGPEDLVKLSLTLSAHILYASGRVVSIAEGMTLATKMLDSGAAYAKFGEWVERQGGNIAMVDEFEQLLNVGHAVTISSQESGIIQHIDAKQIGYFTMLLGAGRVRKEDKIDLSAGITLHKKVGDAISSGESLATLYFNSKFKDQAEEVVAQFLQAYTITGDKKDHSDLILMTIS